MLKTQKEKPRSNEEVGRGSLGFRSSYSAGRKSKVWKKKASGESREKAGMSTGRKKGLIRETRGVFTTRYDGL